MTKPFATLAIACAFLLASLTGAADPPSGASIPSGNVLLKFHIGRLEAGKRVPVRSYDLLVANDGSTARLLSGARVPIPTASSEDDTPGATEDRKKLTKFVYQNVGFSVEAHVLVVDKAKIRLSAAIEDSRVRSGDAGAPPIVETRQLSVEALLTEGVPVEVVRVEGEESGYVEIEAKILR